MWAVAFDLDYKILHEDLSISPYTLDVFRRLHEKGMEILPVSGRSQMSMKPFVEQIGCAAIYISCNGAELWDGQDHTLLRRETFDVGLARRIAAFGKEHGCYAQTYGGAYFYFNQYGHYADSYAKASRLEGQYVGDLEAWIREPVAKILMMDEVGTIADMLTEARERFNGELSVTCSKPWFLEFNPLRATKGIALAEAAERLGFGAEDIIAFGDSLNDLSMLESVGLGVCVANGREDVKARCQAVCGTNEEDGPAHYLEEKLFHGGLCTA